MDEQKFEKTLKDVKLSAIVIWILIIASFVLKLINGTKAMPLLIGIIINSALLLGTIIGCNKKRIYGPICGIVVGILMFLSWDIISMVIGIILLIECVNLIKNMES